MSQLQGGAPVDSTVPLIGALPSIAEYEAEIRFWNREADALRKRVRRYEEEIAAEARNLDLMNAGESWQAARDQSKLKGENLERALRACRLERDLISDCRKGTVQGATPAKTRTLRELAAENRRLVAALKGEAPPPEVDAN